MTRSAAARAWIDAATREQLAAVLRTIVHGMEVVDKNISPSFYGGNPRGDDDRPPDGDDFNELWGRLVNALGILEPNVEQKTTDAGD
jgi:hypothetical protein